jgi:cardiolipin synthetase family protein
MKQRKSQKKGIGFPIRLFISALLIITQLVAIFLMVVYISSAAIWVYTAFQAFSILIVVAILGSRGNPSYKITWIIYILLFPLVGGLFYLIWGGGRVPPHIKKRLRMSESDRKNLLSSDSEALSKLCESDGIYSREARYLAKESGYPLYENTECRYLSPGEKAGPVILKELKKAQKYIFIEFFILAEGTFWDEIHEILLEKLKSGVEVRIMYDDFGSISRQFRGFHKRLQKEGFKITAFNRIRPSVDLFMNNRNHRKIIVIDGKTAFTGGLNIGDEYLNRIVRFGYWMDNLIMLKGEAVKSFIVMFCTMWEFNTGKRLDVRSYFSDYSERDAEGYVLPYCDSPINDKNPAEGIYMQILGTARKYVYILTPYLIIDNTMQQALCLAAQAGVDVRIVTPKIRDKWYVHPATQFTYEELLRSGVRIFEYTPGFIHSKVFLSDDMVATVGTVNMDYRSFYFHFECGVFMQGTSAIKDVKDDIESILADSEEIVLSKWEKRPWYKKLWETLLHVFAPFM